MFPCRGAFAGGAATSLEEDKGMSWEARGVSRGGIFSSFFPLGTQGGWPMGMGQVTDVSERIGIPRTRPCVTHLSQGPCWSGVVQGECRLQNWAEAGWTQRPAPPQGGRCPKLCLTPPWGLLPRPQVGRAPVGGCAQWPAVPGSLALSPRCTVSPISYRGCSQARLGEPWWPLNCQE